MNLIDRIPPQSLDVERIVLGTMLVDQASASICLGALNESCFYSPSNAKIFTCMREMFEKNTPIDIVTLADTLSKKGWLQSVGDASYLGELAESFVSSLNIAHYNEILLEKSALRKIIDCTSKALSSCFKPDGDSSSVIANTLHTELNACLRGTLKREPRKIRDILPSVFKKINQYLEPNRPRDLSTGIIEVDNTVIAQKGDLIIVAGRPSMGKSAFASKIARHNAVKLKRSVLVFSLEMSAEMEVMRGLFSEARVSLYDFNRGMLPKRDFPKLSLGAGPYSEASLWVDDEPSPTPRKIRSKCNFVQSETGLDLVILDYLQLCRGDDRHLKRHEEIESVSRELKAIALDFNVPFVALSQLSREVEKRNPPRPMLSDLRESGSIEQDADIVLMLYREEYYKPDSPKKNIAEIIVGKQRNGRVGTLEVYFDGATMNFSDLVKQNDAFESQENWQDKF